jgi:tRNA(Ile)-lysidine synthase
MLKNLHYILQHNCGLDQQRPIIVGVSGGADSLYLMDELWRFQYQLVIVHINHQIRSNAEQDEQRVGKEAEARGLPFRVKQFDVPEFAREQRIAIEEAARIIRYGLLFAEAVYFDAQAVAVGHTADDQVETVIMHLLRGTGTTGLRGMSYRTLPNPWSEKIPLVRPLIGLWRRDIVEDLDHRGLVPANDESNLDTKFLRNRIRHELIPELESYNPSIRKTFVRMADVLQGDYEIIERAVDGAWSTVVKDIKSEVICLDNESFRRQPRGLQRQLIRRAVGHLIPDLHDVDYEAIERVTTFLERQTPGQVDLVGGLSVLVAGDSLCLVRGGVELSRSAWPQLLPGQEILLNVPGEYQFSPGWTIRATCGEESLRIREINAEAPFSAWLDGKDLKIPLLVRGRIPGDRFQPTGMGGHQVKISDFMINVKIPLRARKGWPLLVSGKVIVWIPGYRIAEGYQAGLTTENLVLVEILPQG